MKSLERKINRRSFFKASKGKIHIQWHYGYRCGNFEAQTFYGFKQILDLKGTRYIRNYYSPEEYKKIVELAELYFEAANPTKLQIAS